VFLIRARSATDSSLQAKELVISVMFRSKPTHHLLAKVDGQQFKLNTTMIQASNLDTVLARLSWQCHVL
jgi:hypothetical protein